MTKTELQITYPPNRLAIEVDLMRQHFAGLLIMDDKRIRQALQDLNGIAGSWCVNYPITTYYYPQMFDGQVVDLSTLDKVRDFYGIV